MFNLCILVLILQTILGQLNVFKLLGLDNLVIFQNIRQNETEYELNNSPLFSSNELQPWISRHVYPRDGDQESSPPAVPDGGDPAGPGARGVRGVLQPQQDQPRELHRDPPPQRDG